MKQQKDRRERGAGSLRQHRGSQNWFIRYYVNGRRIEEPTGTHVKQRALALLQKRLGEREQGIAPVQDLKQLRYENLRESLLNDYAMKDRHSLLSREKESVSFGGLPHLDEFFNGRSVATVTTDTIRQYIAKRKEAGAAPGTINRSLALLRRMLNLARTEGKLQVVAHFPSLKENAPRKGFVTHEQFAKLFTALPERLRPLILMLYWCGCRIGEARKIEWSQVDLERRQILMHGDQTKNEQPRILPLPDELVDSLKAEPNRKGRVFYQGIFRRSWDTACEQSGLGRRIKTESGFPKYEGLIVHDLRRSAIRNLRNAGVPESVIMQISGHRTQSVFRRYSITSAEDLHRAMQQVQAASKVIELKAAISENEGSRGKSGKTKVLSAENGGSLGEILAVYSRK